MWIYITYDKKIKIIYIKVYIFIFSFIIIINNTIQLFYEILNINLLLLKKFLNK